MLRYTRKDRRIYASSLCKVCGVAGMTSADGQKHWACMVNICLWCGSAVCQSHGGGHGTCPICYHGFLPGWSGSASGQACKYKGCKEPAVGVFPRKGRVCTTHAEHILGKDYLAARLAERDKHWEQVEVPNEAQ